MMASPRLSAILVRVVSAPIWLRCGVLLMFGAALFGACWWLFLLDLQQTLSAQAPAQQVEEAKRVVRQSAVQQAQAQLTSASAQKEQLSALDNALPAGSDAHGAWVAVHQASRKHGLRIEHFKPGPVGSEKPYPEQRAALRLSGSFEALLAFTRTLAEVRSPVGIESFALMGSQAGAGAGTGANLVLEAAMLSLHRPLVSAPAAPVATLPATLPAPQSASAASAGPPVRRVENPTGLAPATNSPPAVPLLAAGLSGPVSDPFASQRLAAMPSSASAAGLLSSFPLSAVRMVGSVRAVDHMAALVLAGGTLHAVRVGDALGNARGRVAEIRADGLTVREPGLPGTAQAARVVTLSLDKD